jgi:hypothetical protein
MARETWPTTTLVSVLYSSLYGCDLTYHEEHSPFLTGPLFGNCESLSFLLLVSEFTLPVVTNRSVDDAVEYELSNDLGLTQATSPFEAVQEEIFGNTMAYEGQSFQLHWYSVLTAFFQGHNSVRGHTRDSACNSETNVTLFQCEPTFTPQIVCHLQVILAYTSRSYSNIPTAGLHSSK